LLGPLTDLADRTLDLPTIDGVGNTINASSRRRKRRRALSLNVPMTCDPGFIPIRMACRPSAVTHDPMATRRLENKNAADGPNFNAVHLSPQERDGTQEAQKVQKNIGFLVPFVLLVFRPFFPSLTS